MATLFKMASEVKFDYKFKIEIFVTIKYEIMFWKQKYCS